MSFLVVLLSTPGLMVLLGAWGSLPFMFNIFLSMFTGLMVLFLFQSKESSSGVSLFLVEESISLAVMTTWFLWGGSLLVLMFLLIKSAFAPFHGWLISVLSSCRSETLAWGISLHKTPVVMFFISFKMMTALSFLMLSLLLGTIFLFTFGGVREMIILSSSNIFCSLFLFFWFLSGEGLLFLVCYCFILWSVLLNQEKAFDSVFFFIGLIGIPPLLLFQMKWMLLFPLFQENWSYIFIFILASALAAIAYIRYSFLVDLKGSPVNYSFFLSWALVSGVLPLI